MIYKFGVTYPPIWIWRISFRANHQQFSRAWDCHFGADIITDCLTVSYPDWPVISIAWAGHFQVGRWARSYDLRYLPPKSVSCDLDCIATKFWENMLMSDSIRMFDCWVNLCRRNLESPFENIHKTMCTSNQTWLFTNIFIFTLLLARNSPAPTAAAAAEPGALSSVWGLRSAASAAALPQVAPPRTVWQRPLAGAHHKCVGGISLSGLAWPARAQSQPPGRQTGARQVLCLKREKTGDILENSDTLLTPTYGQLDGKGHLADWWPVACFGSRQPLEWSDAV